MIEKLAGEWRQAGVEPGDTLLIHSNVKRTFKRYLKAGHKLSPNDILDSFLMAVGPSGTVLFPLFNFDFTKGIAFDIRHSVSHMGVLTETARNHPLAVRTGHPIYSFAVIGCAADKFKGVNNFNGYGDDSPFALLKAMNGKIAILDLPDQHSMTFYHHIEEMCEVNYRYHKEFTGQYTNESGKTKQQTYRLFVRNIEQGVVTHVNPTGELLWEKGLYSGFKPKDSTGLRVISAQRMFDFVSNIIASGHAENLLYKIKRKEIE